MNVTMSSALSGIRANLARMNESAARVAGQSSDPATEIVEQIQIKASFQANVSTLDAARDMERTAIRLWA